MSVSIAFDGMPSTSVSRGICSLGRAYARYTGCEGYDGLNAKMEKTLNYHLSVIQLIGSQKVLDIDEGQNKLYRGLFKKKDTTPQSEPQEKLSEKHPFSESARNFIYALANTDTIHLGTYKRDSLKGLPLLLEAVRPGFRMPQEITEGLSNEYESFLSEVVGGGMSVREAVAKSIAERVMPLAREYVNQFEGDTLQEFRDGLAKAVEDSYENILTSAQNAVQGIIRENLEIECNYAVNLISLYTATIQKDFNLDPKEVSAIIKLPSVQEVTDDLKISQTVIADIASALLNFAMVIIWGIVNTILFGLPLAVTYIIYGIKEKDWSFESYTEWLVDNFMSIDLSKLKLYRGGRNSVKKQFEKNYDKSKQEMKNNICRILDEKQIDQIFWNAFKTVAEDCKDRYIKVVNNIFC